MGPCISSEPCTAPLVAGYKSEHIHAAAGIHQLLLARKERVALGTYFDFDILLGRPGVNHVATGAGDGGLLVVGMYILLHLQFHLFTVGKFQINRKIL